VVEGSSAAAAAASFLAHQRLPVPAKEYPAEGGLSQEIPKIGVFICHCGEELKKVLTLSDLVQGTRQSRDVAHVEEVGLACLPDDLDLIKRRIGELGLNRVVVAGCSRWEIRGPIEEMAKGMGFNPTLIEYANIREQCALVHENHPKLATEKAVALIKMAVERARRIQPIQKGRQKLRRRLVVAEACGPLFNSRTGI
jgi:heterodisulfide reductase subunit A-like polyferredoxin